MLKSLKLKLVGFCLLIFAIGCDKEDDELKQGLNPLNSFSLHLNDQLWQPSLIDNNSCFPTLRWQYATVDGNPRYTINAYKDPQATISNKSKNVFSLQIMNVNSPGLYYITDSYGDLSSYAKFVINEDGNQKVYENSVTDTTSVVRIEEFYLNDGSEIIGTKGSFSGILYNRENQSDSIKIDNCRFILKTLLWNDQCE